MIEMIEMAIESDACPTDKTSHSVWVAKVCVRGCGIKAMRLLVLTSAGGGALNLPPFMEVEEGGPEKAGSFPGRTLLLCWPPAEVRGRIIGSGCPL